MPKTKSHAVRRGGGQSPSLMMAILRGFAFSVALMTAFLLFFAFLLLKSTDPSRLLLPAAFGTAGAGAFLGGWRAGCLRRTSGALCGISHGMLLVFAFLAAALVMRSGTLELSSLILYMALLLLSTLGGVLSARKKRRRRRHG